MQKAERKSIQTGPVGNDTCRSLTSTLANARATDEHGATSKEHNQTQPTTYTTARNNNPAISIGVIDDHSLTRECITKSLRQICDLLDITSFATCDECLQSARNYDLLLYHVFESLANDNDQRLASIRKILQIAPVIMLSEVDCPDSIMTAFASGVRGYIPTASTTLELAIEIMRLVKAGGTFFLLSGLSFGAIVWRGETAGATLTRQFTTSQIAVLERLKSGKSNRIIARELKMSESSVKMHIRNIMKKMKVTNRTEAACLASSPWR